jgi:hypothetical protein
MSHISQSLRAAVWNHYIGYHAGDSPCLICAEHTMTPFCFDCSHVIPRCKGGPDELENLRPTCHQCNIVMGQKDMITFVDENKHLPIDDRLALPSLTQRDMMMEDGRLRLKQKAQHAKARVIHENRVALRKENSGQWMSARGIFETVHHFESQDDDGHITVVFKANPRSPKDKILAKHIDILKFNMGAEKYANMMADLKERGCLQWNGKQIIGFREIEMDDSEPQRRTISVTVRLESAADVLVFGKHLTHLRKVVGPANWALWKRDLQKQERKEREATQEVCLKEKRSELEIAQARVEAAKARAEAAKAPAREYEATAREYEAKVTMVDMQIALAKIQTLATTTCLEFNKPA